MLCHASISPPLDYYCTIAVVNGLKITLQSFSAIWQKSAWFPLLHLIAQGFFFSPPPECEIRSLGPLCGRFKFYPSQPTGYKKYPCLFVVPRVRSPYGGKLINKSALNKQNCSGCCVNVLQSGDMIIIIIFYSFDTGWTGCVLAGGIYWGEVWVSVYVCVCVCWGVVVYQEDTISPLSSLCT